MATITPKGTTASPDRKVTVGAAVSGACAFAVWGANTYFLPEPIPAEVGMGIATTVTFVVQYFVKNKEKNDNPN